MVACNDTTATDGFILVNSNLPAPLATSAALLGQQLRFQILQHHVQSGDAPFGGVPHGRAGKVHNVAVRIGPGAFDQLILHNLLGQLGALEMAIYELFWVLAVLIVPSLRRP